MTGFREDSFLKNSKKLLYKIYERPYWFSKTFKIPTVLFKVIGVFNRTISSEKMRISNYSECQEQHLRHRCPLNSISSCLHSIFEALIHKISEWHSKYLPTPPFSFQTDIVTRNFSSGILIYFRGGNRRLWVVMSTVAVDKTRRGRSEACLLMEFDWFLIFYALGFAFFEIFCKVYVSDNWRVFNSNRIFIA